VKAWKIVYTAQAENDLRGIYEYIAYVLQEPGYAAGQSDRIMDTADTLEQLPEKYKLYEEEPWFSMGLRVLPVDNFLIFYLPVERKNTVAVIRIMYGGRDIGERLKSTDFTVPDEP